MSNHPGNTFADVDDRNPFEVNNDEFAHLRACVYYLSIYIAPFKKGCNYKLLAVFPVYFFLV